ncbi:MAG: PD-(D/E)XK nuclease family protein [Bacteroidia bacterium]
MSENWSPNLQKLEWFDIPVFTRKEDTFLSIAGIQYRENTISRIYAYFLNHRNKEISNLLFSTLIELINEKNSKRNFKFEDEYNCQLEYGTTNGNRIDIVIESNSSNNQQQSAIIIENKVFHILNNDLNDYWNSVPAYNKAGVLLTLKSQDTGNSNYVNITHKEWGSRILSQRFPYSLSPKEYIYINDFLKNLISMDTSEQPEEAKFFFEHSEKIMRSVDVYNNTWGYVSSELIKTAEKMNSTIQRNAYDYRYLYHKERTRTVHYSLIIEKLVSAVPQIMVVLEVSQETALKADKLRNILNEAGLYRNQVEKSTRGESHWAHIASKTYYLRKEDWNDLSNFLFAAIETDFSESMNLMIKEVHSE